MSGAPAGARTQNYAVGGHDFIQLDYRRKDIKYYKNYGLKQCRSPYSIMFGCIFGCVKFIHYNI